MADRQFYRPSNRKEEDDGMYDDDSWKLSSQQQSDSMRAASSKADQTLGDIDDLLNDTSSESSHGNSDDSSNADSSASGAEKSAAGRTAASTDGQTKSAGALKDAETKASNQGDDTVGKGYNSSKHGDSKKNVKADEKFWTNKKKAGVGVGAIMGAGVGIIGLGTLTTGTTAVTMAASALHRSSEHNEEQSGDRISKAMGFYKFLKTGDVGYTKMGLVGGKVFGDSLNQLKESGIDYNRDQFTGRPRSLSVDQEKLAKKVSALEDVKIGSDAARQIVAEKLGVSVKAVSVSSDGKMTVDLGGLNQKALRLLTGNSIKIVSDNAAIGTSRALFLKKGFNLPSLFHPFKRLSAAIEQKLIDIVRAREEKKGKSPQEAEKTAKASVAQEDISTRFQDRMQPFQAKATASTESVKSAQNSFTSTVVKGLTFTGALCLIRNTAGEIAEANRAIVVEPAVVEATTTMAAGGQAGIGADMSIDQINAMAAAYQSADGSSIFDGKAMQVLLDPTKDPKGPDLDKQYKQAFNGDSTVAKIKEGVDKGFGGGETGQGIAAIACSPGGLVTQAAIGLGIAIGGEVVSGGALTPGLAALWGGIKFAGSAAYSFVVITAVTDIIKSALVNSQLPQKAFSGAGGGNLLAYGAREMANMTAISSGGVSLGNNDTTILARDDDLEAPRSLATRLFDIHDEHSLMAQAATTYYSSGFADGGVMTGLANVTSSLTDFGGMLSRTFSSFTPHASALAKYDWGFPQYGIPDKVMNNPEFENPWESGTTAAKDLLDGPDSSKYIEKANDCFGVTITKGSDGWDVISDHLIDVTSEDYTGADCSADATVGSGSATDWQRIMMFTFDTLAIKGAACASGIDETVCADRDGSSAAPTTTPPSTTSTNQNGQCVQLDGVDGLNVSNQFTDDTTIIPKVTNVVIHWIDSNPESPEEVHSALASSGTSVQFYVSQSGKMMQLTPCANSRAGHAKNANDFAVGIEIGSPNADAIGDSPPYHKLEDALINNATQKAQVIKLATAIAKKFGITTITVGNQTLYTPSDTCAALNLSFPGTCATQAEAAQFGIVGHYQLQDTKSDPGPTYVTQIQQGVKSGLGL